MHIPLAPTWVAERVRHEEKLPLADRRSGRLRAIETVYLVEKETIRTAIQAAPV